MSEQTYSICETDEDKIRALLLGRRVVTAETGSWPIENRWGVASGRITLDDGTQVYVFPNDGGCSCGAGDYELTHLASVDNVITDVRLSEESKKDETGYEGETSYRIYVFADAGEVNLLSVDGDDGNGYYGTGYELIITPPGAVA